MNLPLRGSISLLNGIPILYPRGIDAPHGILVSYCGFQPIFKSYLKSYFPFSNKGAGCYCISFLKSKDSSISYLSLIY